MGALDCSGQEIDPLSKSCPVPLGGSGSQPLTEIPLAHQGSRLGGRKGFGGGIS